MSLSINLIGAGKLGKTIARLIATHHLAKINGIYNRSLLSSQSALEFIGEGTCYSELGTLPAADIYFITTPDDTISEVSVEIARLGTIKPKSIFVHCSGLLTSDVMSAVKIHDALAVSIHPMKSFADPTLAVSTYPGTYCAIEGDEEGIEIIERLFTKMGSIVYRIRKDKKALYHAAGVFASNYLVTLAQQASNCLMDAGVTEERALEIIISIMKGTLTNIEHLKSPTEALTGPIKRGDISTIESHLAAFTKDNIKLLYATLGQATVELTTHDLATKEKLKASLSI